MYVCLLQLYIFTWYTGWCRLWQANETRTRAYFLYKVTSKWDCKIHNKTIYFKDPWRFFGLHLWKLTKPPQKKSTKGRSKMLVELKDYYFLFGMLIFHGPFGVRFTARNELWSMSATSLERLSTRHGWGWGWLFFDFRLTVFVSSFKLLGFL